jgi:hypothetical protein
VWEQGSDTLTRNVEDGSEQRVDNEINSDNNLSSHEKQKCRHILTQ